MGLKADSSAKKSGPETASVGFDRVAWFYDGLASVVFGSALRRAQLATLASLPTGAPHILVLGGGTGWVLLEIIRRCPQATVLYLEASTSMLTRAKALLLRHAPQALAQVEFRHGTQSALKRQESFDVLASFFVLDCFTPANLPPALARLGAAARPGARWLVADFQPARNWWQRALLATMYLFFRLTAKLPVSRLPDWPVAMAEQGWKPLGTAGKFYGGAVLSATFQRPQRAKPAVGSNFP